MRKKARTKFAFAPSVDRAVFCSVQWACVTTSSGWRVNQRSDWPTNRHTDQLINEKTANKDARLHKHTCHACGVESTGTDLFDGVAL